MHSISPQYERATHALTPEQDATQERTHRYHPHPPTHFTAPMDTHGFPFPLPAAA
jgi:hypothetical protein